MAEFPASPIPPKEFMESWLPGAFAEAELPPGTESVDVKLGVKLEGSEGGEWIFHMSQGSLTVTAEPRDDAAFTVVQSVDDWRGALWEGRGGAFGQGAVALFKPGSQAPSSGGGMGGGMSGAAPSPAALEQMRALDGVIKMVVAGGDDGDWSVAFKLGPGEIPAEPTTTVTVTAEDAEAMASGQLDPMQAFMAGRIQVAGDMALMMQMQAIQMQAAAAAATPPSGQGS
jgi:putative sterol carrier protein